MLGCSSLREMAGLYKSPYLSGPGYCAGATVFKNLVVIPLHDQVCYFSMEEK